MNDKRKAIIAALTKMAIRRQAEVDTATLMVYAEDLEQFLEPKEIDRACHSLGLTARKEHEPAFPAVGNIIAHAEQLMLEDEADRAAINAYNARQLKAAPVSKAEAGEWLGKIKQAAHGVKADGE